MRGSRDYQEIWNEVGPTLWRAIFAFSGGKKEVADDAVAEAFARAIERDGEVKDPTSYCYRVAFRLAAADLRHIRTGESISAEVRASAEEAASETRLDILSALRSLSPTQRAAVYLHYQADLPVRDVARLLGTTHAAVRVQLMRGRRRLARLLGEAEP